MQPWKVQRTDFAWSSNCTTLYNTGYGRYGTKLRLHEKPGIGGRFFAHVAIAISWKCKWLFRRSILKCAALSYNRPGVRVFVWAHWTAHVPHANVANPAPGDRNRSPLPWARSVLQPVVRSVSRDPATGWSSWAATQWERPCRASALVSLVQQRFPRLEPVIASDFRKDWRNRIKALVWVMRHLG